MEILLRQLLAPFVAVVVFVLANYIARLLIPLIPPGRVKAFLTKPRSNRSEFFERMDAKMFAFLRSVVRKARGQ